MFRLVRVLVIPALAGAAAGAVSLAIAFAARPALVLDMERDLPRTTSGIYPVERAGEETFAWTGARAAVRLPGFDRGRDWECAVRLRAGRGPGLPMPRVAVGVDGITAAGLVAHNEYENVTVRVPAQEERDGLVLTIAAEPTFVPGPGDKRQLGVQIDRVSCTPVGGGPVLPPARAVAAATLSGAAFGAAFGVALPGVVSPSLAALLTGGAVAVPLSTGPAPYHPYLERVRVLALWIAGLLAVAAMGLRNRAHSLSTPARVALAFSAATLFLHLVALLHPLKNPVDVVFHAHRFQTVLAGNYFFTQPMPSGVRFPYAVALYVFAIPWSALTQDYVTLLRIVVSSCHVVAGGVLYLVVARLWRDGFAGAVAVALFHLAPLPYIVIGNANMTYAFGQSVAIATIAAAAVWRLGARDFVAGAALFVLAAAAFLSHVGVFPLLFAALIAIGTLYWLYAAPNLRAAGAWLVLVAVLAAVFSIGIYYGRFAEAYRTLDRVRGKEVVTAPAPAPGVTAGASSAGQAAAGSPEQVPRHRRLLRGLSLLRADAGWPVLLLALAGAWRLRSVERRDRLKLVIWGMAATYAVFLAFAVAIPVEPGFQRYADEFISRVDYATLPAVAILGALGVSWAWRAGIMWRAASIVLLAAAAMLGIERWLGWLS